MSRGEETRLDSGMTRSPVSEGESIPMRGDLWILALLMLTLVPAQSTGQEAGRGTLLIIGGGLRPDNAPLYQRLIERAGGRDRARIGILPTASLGAASSRR